MNSAFDERYDIRQATYDEIPEIMEFIDKYWRKGHILAKNRELFEYEYVIEGKVNFYIAKDKKTHEIESLQGFIYTSKSESKKDIWGSISKTRNDHPNKPFLCRELMVRIFEDLNIRYELGVGVNKKTALAIAELDGYYSHKMNHYYRLSDRVEYKIAKIENKILKPKNKAIQQYSPKKVNSIEELKKLYDFSITGDSIPYKDEWYINRRYFKYPFYDYSVYALNNAFFVTREQKMNGEKILRIVDYIGNQSSFGVLYDYFSDKLSEYEYIDFYNFGFKEEFLKEAGFINKEETPENIIPNYFSPFVKENIDIYVHSPVVNTLYFKGDSDQDRPN